MKKILLLVFKFFWVLVVGIPSTIFSALVGIAYCLTLVGIPFGLQHFKFIPLVLPPSDKVVVIKFSSHPFLNFVWLIFGGFLLAIVYIILVGVLCLSIVGLPLGRRLGNMIAFFLSPFGAEIVTEKQYAKTNNRWGESHNMNVLCSRILADSEKIMLDPKTGTEKTVSQYIVDTTNGFFSWKKIGKQKNLSFGIFCIGAGIAMIIFFSLGIFSDEVDSSYIGGFYMMIITGLVMIIFGIYNILLPSMTTAHSDIKVWSEMVEVLNPLYDLYPDGSQQCSYYRSFNKLWLDLNKRLKNGALTVGSK